MHSSFYHENVPLTSAVASFCTGETSRWVSGTQSFEFCPSVGLPNADISLLVILDREEVLLFFRQEEASRKQTRSMIPESAKIKATMINASRPLLQTRLHVSTERQYSTIQHSVILTFLSTSDNWERDKKNNAHSSYNTCSKKQNVGRKFLQNTENCSKNVIYNKNALFWFNIYIFQTLLQKRWPEWLEQETRWPIHWASYLKQR